MNKTDATKLALILTKLSAYYKTRIDPDIIEMYVEDLLDLPFDQVIQVLRDYRSDPRNKSMPLPANIREKFNAIETDEEKSEVIARRIYHAISRYGVYWQDGHTHMGRNMFRGADGIYYKTWVEAAQSVFGNLGLEIVNLKGGWNSVCSLANESGTDQETWILKELESCADLVIKRSRSKRLNQIPSMPTPLIQNQEQDILKLVNQSIKNLPNSK